MKVIYPVILHKTKDKIPYYVEIPDLNIETQGKSLENAVEMARDAISIALVTMQDNKKKLPASSDLKSVKTDDKNAVITLVDADLEEYRRSLDNRAVRKNCTIPSWLCYEAEKANINFSQTLQNALKNELGLTNK